MITLPVRQGTGIIIDTGLAWILQKRDNKDGILWPDKVGLWGGSMETSDEGNFEKTALRELHEETGLSSSDVIVKHFGHIEYEHQTLKGETVMQHSELFVAYPKKGVAIHVYEGESTYELPANPDLENIDMTEFAPGVSEALEQLQKYYEYQPPAA